MQRFWSVVYFMAVILGWNGLEKLFRLGAICFRSLRMQGAALRGAESSASGCDLAGCDTGIHGWARTTGAPFARPLYQLSYMVTLWLPGLGTR